MKKALVTAVYVLSSLITLALSGLFLSHSRYIPNPDAMLPMQLWELATVWLAFGAMPMAAACALMCSVRRTHGQKTLLVFLPALPCAAAALFWLCVWLVGLFRMLAPGQ